CGGGLMLVRRGALGVVGLFDEGYCVNMADLDRSYRCAAAGWVTWYEPSVAVTHVKGGTSGRNRRFRANRAFHYGMYRFYRSHYAHSRPRVLNLAVYGAIAAKFTGSAARSAFNRRLLRRT